MYVNTAYYTCEQVITTACGNFHSAATTEEGRVLTWGQVCCRVLQCCSRLQRVTVCCIVAACYSVVHCCRGLQFHTAESCFLMWPQVRCSVLQRVASCCSVLQRVAACCSVLQRVVACHSVLQCMQCVAVCGCK